MCLIFVVEVHVHLLIRLDNELSCSCVRNGDGGGGGGEVLFLRCHQGHNGGKDQIPLGTKIIIYFLYIYNTMPVVVHDKCVKTSIYSSIIVVRCLQL